jgi:hypothetical protein
MSALRTAGILALLAATAAAVAISETEPDGFTTPAPQALGTLGAGGLAVNGVLDPTSPTGLSPGDDDGFSFSMASAGPFRAVVDDGAGATFVLGLAEETEDGLVLRAAVIGPAPLTLSRPALAAGTVYRLGVAALGDGSPLAYTLSLDLVDAVPPWTGETCPGPVAEVEPNEDTVSATDLGWFERRICGEGDVAVVSPIDSGITGDADTFRFRNVLPVPATLKITADPGTLDVEVSQLIFVGPATIAAATFGSETTLGLPALEPGADYTVRVSARSGEAPVHYSFFIDPVGPENPPAPEPLDLGRTVLKLGPDAKRSRFSFRGTFAAGLGEGLGDGTDLILKLRGGETALASGKLVLDSLGRLVWKAPKGLDGIRSFQFDPYVGTVKVTGRGVDLAGSVDPADPAIYVDMDFGPFRLGTTESGVFSRKGRMLRLKE